MVRLAVAAALALALCRGAMAAEAKDELPSYLTDFSAGAVSAGTLVGLEQSAISEVQSSQDLVVALKPLASGQSKTGFGLALSPFRTNIMPMSAQDYANREGWEDKKNRLLGGLTLSYAENKATIASADYRKHGFSVDTSLYLNKNQDPVVMANKAFHACGDERRAAEDRFAEAAAEDDKAGMRKAKAEAEEAVKTCLNAEANKSPWNADRVSLSFGGGWIRRDDGTASRESLGRSLTVQGLFGAGKQGALQLALRRTTHEVDLSTLGASPEYKGSSLVAGRFTYGSEDGNGETKFLAEASNARASQVTVSNAVFKYAVGLDKKIAKGVWLQFRMGKNRTLDGTSTQTTSLMQLSFTPSAGLFAK